MKNVITPLLTSLFLLISFQAKAIQQVELQVNADSNALELKAMESLIAHLDSSDEYALISGDEVPEVKINLILISIKKGDEVAAISISVLATRKQDDEYEEVMEFNSRVINVEKLQEQLIKIISKILV